jgi:hypothetical protein
MAKFDVKNDQIFPIACLHSIYTSELHIDHYTCFFLTQVCRLSRFTKCPTPGANPVTEAGANGGQVPHATLSVKSANGDSMSF